MEDFAINFKMMNEKVIAKGAFSSTQLSAK